MLFYRPFSSNSNHIFILIQQGKGSLVRYTHHASYHRQDLWYGNVPPHPWYILDSRT